MDIALLTNEVTPVWDPSHAATRGLGGSEEACVLWAEALARRGHAVTVYASLACASGVGAFGVRWEPREAFRAGVRRDALVTWKERAPWLIGATGARMRIHWSSDVEVPQQWTGGAIRGLDAIVALSTAHARAWAWAGGKVRTIPQGVGGEYLVDPTRAPRVSRAIYCASPDRGLDFVLKHWARVRAGLGIDELFVTYALPFQLGAPIPGVMFAPGLPVPTWNALLASCKFWIHPVHGPHGPVPSAELFCLNAVKAQAFGVMPVVPEAMVRASGLGDTVKRYVDLSALILRGDASVRENPAARADLPISWDTLVERYWEPLLRGEHAEVAA